MSDTTKILIIRLSSIGDVMLTTPVVRCLKKQLFGDAELHFLIKKKYAVLLEGNPYLSKIHVLDDDLNKMAEELRKEDFHYVIDLHKNFRSYFIRRKLKVLTFDFHKLNFKKWILVNFKIDLLPDIHIVDRYFEAVKHLSITNDHEGLDFFISAKETVDLGQFGLKNGQFIVFAIGAAHLGKKLPVGQMIELCWRIEQKLGGDTGEIILIGGEEDRQNGDQIASSCAYVKSLCGQLSIHQSASLMQQSKLVITFDSGMMHVASALKKKIISIWGATVPKFGMYPYLPDPESVIIEADHLKFRPTSKLGNSNSKKERRTMEEIDLNRIVDSIVKMW